MLTREPIAIGREDAVEAVLVFQCEGIVQHTPCMAFHATEMA
jgi:hypothetical protein